jgi:two-component system sensor histidine kinase KdpD
MESSQRGKLKIFLGYAAGVGKTYQMLEEGRALLSKGIYVVIGYFEPHGRKDTIALTQGLPIVPRKKIEYRGAWFEEMDTEAIVERHPAVCLVDELPHANIPGSARPKRWDDVEVLRDAGIDVFTTMNIQHLESLNDQVWRITGVQMRETIPDWVMQRADDVVMVDLTPRALLNRLERGAVYPADKVQRALANFFRESTLASLRELALRQTAHEVESRKSEDLRTASSVENESSAAPKPDAEITNTSNERILIFITADPNAAMLVRRGKRFADYLHTDCFAVAVHSKHDLNDLPASEREAIDRYLNFARNLHIEPRILQGKDVAQTLVEFARLNGITQIFVNRPAKDSRFRSSGWHLVENLVQVAKDMRVTVVAERKRPVA